MPPELSPAARSVLAVVRAIPRGRVASYGQVAAAAGLKGRARLVGWVLRHAGADAALPWHRVLRASGGIAFPRGSAPHDEQVRRLARERVEVRAGRVDLARYGWRRTLDEQLWGPPPAIAPARRAHKSAPRGD